MEGGTKTDQFSDPDVLTNDNEMKVFHICVPETGFKTSITTDNQNLLPTKVYRRRWLMLLSFILVSMTNAFQWIQFSIITSLLIK